MSDLDKKYPLRLDTRINFKNLIPHFYISDNQTNDFYIKLTNDNKPVEVEDIIVVIAVINPNGNINSSILDTKTEKGLIYCNLPNELKNVVGVYKARIMCISGEERIVSNTFEYKVDTDEFQLIDEITEDSEEMLVLSEMLSKLSNMEIESQANEAGRTANENERITNEAKRIEDENLRQQAENERDLKEEARVVAELNRESTEADRVLGEQTRVNSERDRISAENERVSAENKRKENENKRIEKENANIQAELNRVQAESNRVQAELKREESENARKNSEDTRNSNEDVRKQNELKRQSNENSRITNETTRTANEAVRISNEEKRNSTALENKEKIEELYNTTVTKTDKLIKDTTNTANSLIENTTNKMNKLVEDSTNDINKLIEDTNSSIEGYAEAEAQRQANENERVEAEIQRAKVNADRQQAEQTRVTNERNRKEAELARASAERSRVNNESIRISNENVRKNNEEKRKEDFKAKMIEVDNALANIENPDINVLMKDNTEEFIPTGDYNPATKKYVDDFISNTVQIMGKDVVIYNDEYNVFKNSSIKDDILKYLTDYYCYEYDSPANDSYLNLNNHLRNILNKCSEVATTNNDIVEITCSSTNAGITNFFFSIDEYEFLISIDSELGTVLINGTFSTGSCTREVKIFDEYATKEYVNSNIPCRTVNRNEVFRITSDEINYMLGNSQLTFTISSSKIINKDRRYIIGFSHKEKLGYLNSDVLDFDFETYSMKVYKTNENTFKVVIDNFPTQFIGAESEPTITDLVLYEEEIQFIDEKYMPDTIASKKYVDDAVANVSGGTADSVNWENVVGKPTKLSEFTNDKGFIKVTGDIDDGYILSYVDEHNVLERENVINKAYQAYINLFHFDTSPNNGDISNLSSNVTEFADMILNICTEVGEDIFVYFDFITESPITFTIIPYASSKTFAMFINDGKKNIGINIEYAENGTGTYEKIVFKTITSDKIATVATSGDYNDLTNKPTIPTVPSSLPADGGNADTVGGYTIWTGTQAQYDALSTKDSNTIYLIKEG